ncbi:MAG: tetratricopeptide repeat protein [FCB group bacterium]|jgi:hypothetical protein|nr:tetratricopeptide repeat protein [FCB group bacterium]
MSVRRAKGLCAWALPLAAAVCLVAGFARYGDGIIRRAEVRRLLTRAEDHLQAYRVDEAIPLLARAVQVRTDHLPARRLLVRTLLRAGRFAEAAYHAEAGVTRARSEDLGDARLLAAEVRRERGPDDETMGVSETGGGIR